MFQISLEQGYSLLVFGVAAAAALGGTVWIYRYARRDLSWFRWAGLLLLRCTAVVTLLLLLFRPTLSFPTESNERRGVVLLLDTSASMATTDGADNPTRLDLVRPKIAAWWQQLGGDFDLHLLHFAGEAAPLKGLEEMNALEPTGDATSLTRALQAAAARLPRRDLEAVILVSDGVHNAAGDPVETARRLGVVVHTVGVGVNRRNLPSYRDVQVGALDCPPQLVFNNRARVTAQVDSVGLAGRVVKVLLEEDGKVIAQQDLTLRSGADPQSVAFEFLPGSKGRHTYTVRVPVLPDEAVKQNNERSAPTQVVDARIRVLYLEGALRAEYGALMQRFLAKDPDIEFCALVQTRRNVFTQRTNIDGLQLAAIPSDAAALERFNVFVLGDLDSRFLKPAQMELLARRVRDGAGLVMLGGYNSLGPGGYGGTPLEEVLPVTLGGRKVGQVVEPFLPALTPEGRSHPIFANIDKFFPPPGGAPEVKGLPPLQGCVKVAGPRPGAAVLAVHPGAGLERMAVLAVQPVGRGRSAVFTGDTTRNWHQVPRALDQESPFTRFWGQLVRWLANRSDSIRGEANVIARTDRAYYDPDAPVTITALVRDKDGEGTERAKVKATVRTPAGKDEVVPLPPTSGSAGHYEGRYEPKRSGAYQIVVEAEVKSATLKADKLAIEVGRPNLEYDRLDLDDRMLGRIAEATGGRYHHVSTADRLIESLRGRAQRRRVVHEQRLYDPPLCWALAVGVLSFEWLLRKRYRLR